MRNPFLVLIPSRSPSSTVTQRRQRVFHHHKRWFLVRLTRIKLHWHLWFTFLTFSPIVLARIRVAATATRLCSSSDNLQQQEQQTSSSSSDHPKNTFLKRWIFGYSPINPSLPISNGFLFFWGFNFFFHFVVNFSLWHLCCLFLWRDSVLDAVFRNLQCI